MNNVVNRTVDLYWGIPTDRLHAWNARTLDIAAENPYWRKTQAIELRDLPGFIPTVVRYEDVKGLIDMKWLRLNKDKAEYISTSTFSKVVYIFTDFVVKVGGKDVKTEAELWFEICDNPALADMFIETYELQSYDNKYVAIQAKVDGTVGVDSDWWDCGERHTFVNAIRSFGYAVEDLHHMNVAMCRDRKVRTFDYSWWSRV